MKRYILGILFFIFCTQINHAQTKKWSLEECIQYAIDHNLEVKQRELNLEEAKLTTSNAKGNFLPNLNGSSSGNYNVGLSPDQTGILTNTNNFNGTLNLSSSGVIFNGFRNTNTYKQAQLGVESSLYDLKKIENDISLRVVNTYLNVLFAKENLEVASVLAAISKKQIEAAKARFEAGAIAKGELLNFQSTAANDLQSVILQENALDLALLNIAQLLQEPVKGFDDRLIAFLLLNMKNTNCNLIELVETKR